MWKSSFAFEEVASASKEEVVGHSARFKGSTQIFHVVLVRGDENTQENGHKCTFHMRSFYMRNEYSLWSKQNDVAVVLFIL